MNKKHFIFIFTFVFLVSLNLSAKKKDKYEKWMDEVNPIITDAKKAEFKKLKTEKEKEFFIKLFWTLYWSMTRIIWNIAEKLLLLITSYKI